MGSTWRPRGSIGDSRSLASLLAGHGLHLEAAWLHRRLSLACFLACGPWAPLGGRVAPSETLARLLPCLRAMGSTWRPRGSIGDSRSLASLLAGHGLHLEAA